MGPGFNCTLIYYNTPVFFKVSQLGDNDYFAESLDSKLANFTLKKRHGEWFADSETTHSLAVQIGKQIDKLTT
ncbi:MAG: hypothetical protein ABIN89_29020 [Chitinophagaceae bacterium]